MSLTQISQAMRRTKEQLLREAHVNPAAADHLNLAIAQLNDAINTTAALARTYEPELDVPPAHLEALQEVERLKAQLAEARGEPAPETAREAVEGIVEDLKAPEPQVAQAGDMFAGEGIDVNKQVKLAAPEVLAAEQARAAGMQRGRTDPDQEQVAW